MISRRFWTYIKHQNTDYKGISNLKQHGKLMSDPSDKANALNAQFHSVFTPSLDITQQELVDNYTIDDQVYPSMLDGAGVQKLLKKLKPGKAAGPDNIKPLILKELAEQIAPILTHIFQRKNNSGIVPSEWKTAHIAPLFKKEQRYNPENYRPISLTSICSKIMEHIIVSNIMKHADQNNILYPLQHGFRKSRSCETQLLEFIDDVTNNLESGKQTDVTILDFSKAFDKVSHSLLSHKLSHYGVTGKTNNWISNFLSNRKQAVMVEGELSSYLPVESGVPQGSVLGPSLFLYYINDLPLKLNSTVRLFADDTMAYITVTSDNDARLLQADLDMLAKWEDKWKMAFHPDKCNVLSITRSRTPITYSYTLRGHILQHTNTAKYLGLTISSDLRWDKHISGICNKATSTLSFLRRNLKIGSRHIKEQAYKTLVRPLTEYSSVVWDPYHQQDIHKLEMVQRRGARFVLNRHRNLSSVDSMIDTLEWPSLERRRKEARIIMLYKIKNNLVAIDPSNKLAPNPRQSRHHHNQSLKVPFSRTIYRQMSFFPRTISDWNKLPQSIINSPSLGSFKAAIKSEASQK